MNEKAEFTVRVLKQYALENQIPTRSTSDLSPMEQWLILQLLAVIHSLPIERFDAEDWLKEKKDIWNHPRITDRTDKESYEVADLMAEFANQLLIRKIYLV